MKQVNDRPLKVGDRVNPNGYFGEMIISHLDEIGTTMLNEHQWYCYSEEYDTHFDTYSESDLKLIED